MKTFAILAAIMTTAIPSSADTNYFENFSPHLSTNTPIIWHWQISTIVYRKTFGFIEG